MFQCSNVPFILVQLLFFVNFPTFPANTSYLPSFCYFLPESTFKMEHWNIWNTPRITWLPACSL